ncbi:MAG TPA: hypothetical protein DD706_00760 [Nitrospiraceae bacterium]|nr:hypothetical protein [Nitrospiraceae bacterium]
MAGAPLKTLEGHNLGTLCVIDRVSRELTQNQMKSLQALCRQAVAQMELRRQLTERDCTLKQLKDAVNEVEIPNGWLPICANCKVIRNEKGEWVPTESCIRDRSEAEFIHGICPSCKKDGVSQ